MLGQQSGMIPLTTSRSLYRSAGLILLAGVFGAAGGFIAYKVIHPRWTASITIQVGQISTPAQGGVATRQLESTQTAADRFNSPASRLNVLKALGLPEPGEGNRDANVIFDKLQAKTGKSPDLITLEATAYSRSDAVKALATSLHLLADSHQALYSPPIQRMKGDLESNQARLAAVEKEYESTFKWLKAATEEKSVSSSARDILVTNMAAVINSQAIDLKQRIAQLQEALDPTRSYATKAIGDIYSPRKASSLGPRKLTAGGAAFCVVMAILFLFARKSRALLGAPK